DQLGALKSQDGWVTELKELLQSCLGMKLVTKGKTWQTIAEELWRFILFSEFCLDLPEPLPESLATVPRSDTNARSIIEDICDKLRYNDKTKPTYIERAEIVEKELELSKRCKSISDFGLRDTFAFEERSFLLKAIDGYKKNNLDQLRKILERHSKSIWTADAEIQAQWEIIVSALNLFKTCEDNERQLSQHSKSLESLIEFYVGSLREVDRMQREFEQSVSDMHEFDAMTPVIEIARKSYMNLAAKAQNIFIKHIEENGWPPVGRLSNSNVFDTFIAPKLQEKGNKVAYILVDSLRYELGVVLEKQLTELGATQINASSAKLPTVTSVGMASLLPGADQSFSLEFQDETLIPNIGGGELKNVTKRMDFIRQRYGQRFHEMPLQEFLVHKKNIPSTVELLVLRSAEIDSSLETNPELTLKTIQDAIKRIRIAVSKLQKQDFKEIVIATDHGFFLNYSPEAGDVCPKPPGNWHNVHDRILVGDGSGDNSNYSLPAETLGVKGNFAKISGPRALVPYCCGKIYFHGGLSLQESILPVITLKTREAQTEKISFYVLISYKNNASRITTRLPVLDLQLYAEEFFALDHTVEILLEAVDKNNKIVGSSKIGGRVDPSTGTIHIKAGERIQITMKMDEEFEGKFTVRALNPSTMAEYCKLELETNYVG
ncbi:MAG TPA: PglZ domain-containing protein, partial [Candidatus Wallbacteria bacterium]|nr:PglZ domain-containing protein [Candidatus Wallbacteria bacterium]